MGGRTRRKRMGKGKKWEKEMEKEDVNIPFHQSKNKKRVVLSVYNVHTFSTIIRSETLIAELGMLTTPEQNINHTHFTR